MEQEKTLAALQTAIRMEIDGKAYYLKASRAGGNSLGKKLLKTLAGEEDLHRQKFTQIFDALSQKKAWPVSDFQPDGGKKLRSVFASVVKEAGSGAKAGATELDAVRLAIDMETKTYDFYKGRAASVAGAERNFYEAVAAEERGHHLVLLDYYEYLKDPAAYFVDKEHPSLDGA